MTDAEALAAVVAWANEETLRDFCVEKRNSYYFVTLYRPSREDRDNNASLPEAVRSALEKARKP